MSNTKEPPIIRSRFWPKATLCQRILLDKLGTPWIPDCKVETPSRDILVHIAHTTMKLGIIIEQENFRHKEDARHLEALGWLIQEVDQRDALEWEWCNKAFIKGCKFSSPIKCAEMRAGSVGLDESEEYIHQ